MFEYYHLYFHSRNHFFSDYLLIIKHSDSSGSIYKYRVVFFYYVIASLHPLGHLVLNLMESRSFSKQCKHIKVKVCCVWKG